MKWFDILRNQQELVTNKWTLNSSRIQSNVTCIVPRIEIQYPGVWDSNDITFTNPKYPQNILKAGYTITFTCIADTMSSEAPKQFSLGGLNLNDLPETALLSMTNITGGTAYNDLIVDTANRKVYYKEFLKCYTLTGEEAWTEASSSMPGKNIILHPIISDINESSDLYPFFGMTHYKHDWTGAFGDGVTQGWDIWGRQTNLDPNALQLYIYNYGFDTPEIFMNYIKTLYNSSTPMKFYYITQPSNVDITNTNLGQALLYNLTPVQKAGTQSVIIADTTPAISTFNIRTTYLHYKE